MSDEARWCRKCRGLCSIEEMDVESDGVCMYCAAAARAARESKVRPVDDSVMKCCSRCHKEKPSISGFSADKSRRGGGRDGICRSCRGELAKARRLAVRPAPDVVDPVGMKVCTGCGRSLELHRFWKDKRSTDGHRSDCFDCSTNDETGRRKSEANEVLSAGFKTCARCHERLPVDRFFVSKRSIDGYSMSCNACHNGNAKRDPVEAAEDAEFLERRSARWNRFDEKLSSVKAKRSEQMDTDRMARDLWGSPLDMSGQRDYRPPKQLTDTKES